MQLIPAIDILEGKVVRLRQGQYRQVTVWDDDPLQLARRYQAQGARRLHLVNLDGAREPERSVAGLVRRLAGETALEIQVGGGVRSLGGIRDLLDAGASRIVLGTLLFTQPELVRQAVLLFGESRLVAALDVRDSRVRIRAWAEDTGIAVAQALGQVRELGLSQVLMTAIDRDGMACGPDLELYERALSAGHSIELTASGGVRGLEDLRQLSDTGCSAAVAGRALLSGQFSLAEWREPKLPEPSRPEGASGLAVRIIPCLDVDAGRVVKGTAFRNLRDAGDPARLARHYCREGADELVFLDITASSQRRQTAAGLAAAVAGAVDIPFTIGGGVRSAEDARRLLDSGADKVSINSAAVARPRLLEEVAALLGSANTVSAIDARRRDGSWSVLVSGGREDTGRDAVDWAVEAQRCGAGEILLTSFDRDGTQSGFDLELIRSVKRRVSIPVIASGGAGSLESFSEAARAGADALLAASVFHFGICSIGQVKAALRNASIRVRS